MNCLYKRSVTNQSNSNFYKAKYFAGWHFVTLRGVKFVILSSFFILSKNIFFLLFIFSLNDLYNFVTKQFSKLLPWERIFSWQKSYLSLLNPYLCTEYETLYYIFIQISECCKIFKSKQQFEIYICKKQFSKLWFAWLTGWFTRWNFRWSESVSQSKVQHVFSVEWKVEMICWSSTNKLRAKNTGTAILIMLWGYNFINDHRLH